MSGMHTKERIFYASAKLFSEKGYSNVSVREIADNVGIKAASIYNHYPSKESILEDIFDCIKKRQDAFQQELEEKTACTDYKPDWTDMSLVYDPSELELMLWLTRIMYMEQFTSDRAADMLVGRTQRYYVDGYQYILETLYKKGRIKNEKNIYYYAEIMARLAQSMQLEFAHPELENNMEDSRVLIELFYDMILAYEKK